LRHTSQERVFRRRGGCGGGCDTERAVWFSKISVEVVKGGLVALLL
jgi:hypothetical protein